SKELRKLATRNVELERVRRVRLQVNLEGIPDPVAVDARSELIPTLSRSALEGRCVDRALRAARLRECLPRDTIGTLDADLCPKSVQQRDEDLGLGHNFGKQSTGHASTHLSVDGR